MHLIFVTSLVPDGAPTTGYEIANSAVIDALRRAGARVTVLGFTWPGRTAADPENSVVLGEVDVRNDAASPATKARWLATAVAGGLAVSSAKLRVVEPSRLRAAIASLEPFDAFVLNAVALPGAFEDVFAGRPQIFVAHNVEHRSARENAASASSPVQRLLFAREARRLEALEKRLCERAAFVFTFAEEDCTALGLAGSGRCLTLPLVTRASAPARSPREAVADLALIGTWTWQPNRIGLEWFLDEVVPLLAPDVSIRVAGAVPAGLRASSRVEIVGKVPDARAFVRSARVLPLVSRAGTGVQLKTIEAFELGLPTVATSRSVRGIAALPPNCTVVDEPRAFAAALMEKLGRARRGEDLDVDGSAFHAAQRAALDAAVGQGLARLSAASAGRQVAA